MNIKTDLFSGCATVLAGGALVLGASSASAQTSNAASAPSDASAVLEEIIVTAENNRADVQKTPIAISVLAGDGLERQAKNSIEDALRTVAGVTIRLSNNAATTKIAIRGIQEGGQGTDPSVSLSNDGIYQSHPGSSPNFDIARIEVLKGPQGTLYGRNATGGAVNIISNDPTDQFGGSVMGQIGNLSAGRIDGVLNVPINDLLLSRLAVSVDRRDGYLSNGGNDRDITAIRGKLLFKPAPDLRVLLSGEYDSTRGHGTGVVVAPLSSHSDPWTSAEPAGAYRAKKKAVYASVNWDLSFATLSSLSSFYRIEQMADTEISGPSGYAFGGLGVGEQFTQEVRISQPEGSRIKWQLGAYYLNWEQTTNPHAPLIDAPIRSASATGAFQPAWTAAQAAADPGYAFRRPTGTGGFQAPIALNTTTAVFGQVTYPVTEALRLTGGLRYTEDTRRRQNRIFNGGTVETSPYGPYTLTSAGTAPCTATNQPACLQQADFHAVTYKLGLEFDLSPTAMVYLDTSKGFKSGGLQTLPVPTGTALSYRPEYLVAYEGGIKSRLFDNTLQLNGDIYYYDYKDKQLIVVGAPIPPSIFPSTPTMNVGRAEVYGFETAADWAITPDDRLSLSVAYNYSNVKEGVTGAGTNLAPGDALPNAPLWTERVSYEHTFRLGGDKNIRAGVDGAFFSSYYIDTNKTASEAYQPSYSRIDAHVSYAMHDGDWVLTAFGNNLGNTVVRSALSPNNRLILEAPRTYGVSLRAAF